MKRAAIYLILLLFIFAGCATRKRCNRKFPPVIKDSIVYIVKYRDTTIYHYMPGEKVNGLVPLSYSKDSVRLILKPYAIPFPDIIVNKIVGAINTDTSRIETSLALSLAWIRRGLLHHELIQKDTTLELKLKNALREIETFKQTTKTHEVNILTWWQKTLIWIGGSFLVLVVVFIAYKLLKLIK